MKSDKDIWDAISMAADVVNGVVSVAKQLAREKMRKDAWVKNVQRVLGYGKEFAESEYDRIVRGFPADEAYRITESGPEMVKHKHGNLTYLPKGSNVLPADKTKIFITSNADIEGSPHLKYLKEVFKMSQEEKLKLLQGKWDPDPGDSLRIGYNSKFIPGHSGAFEGDKGPTMGHSF